MDCGQGNMKIIKFVTHSYFVQKIASHFGWLPAARYTNLRDVRLFDQLGFLDIDWKNYNFKAHLAAVRLTKPIMTVARDIEHSNQYACIIDEAQELAQYSKYVVIVPKAPSIRDTILNIPENLILGYSVPTQYGATSLPLEAFGRRKIHLLGGRPDVQRKLADILNVVSLDCNRFTLDAKYGDYFDGVRFRPHPIGGYKECIEESIKNIEKLWDSYIVSQPLEVTDV
jgi:hypothetical protein